MKLALVCFFSFVACSILPFLRKCLTDAPRMLFAPNCPSSCLRRRSAGTGKHCAKASDAVGGPQCQGSQVGVCCYDVSGVDALTLSGDGSLSAAGPSANPESGGIPSCASFLGPPLSPFCCDQMDVQAQNPGPCEVSDQITQGSFRLALPEPASPAAR